MKRRRYLLGGVALMGSVSFAGCQDEIRDIVLDASEFEADAEPAELEPDAVETAGYSHVETEQYRIEEDFEVAGEEQRVEAGNWLASYAKDEQLLEAELEDEISEDLQTVAAGLFLVSTPDLSIAGQSINPADRLDDEDLLATFEDEIGRGSIESIEETDSNYVTILETETEVTHFEATVSAEGEEYDGMVYMGRVENEGDIVVVVGVHLDEIDAEEELFDLMEHVIHPA